MRKLPIIILVFCVLFSAYFLWNAQAYTQRAQNAQAELMRLEDVNLELLKDIEILKQSALEAAAHAKIAESKAMEVQRELEACKK